jgi:hypothetical protein
MRVTRVLGILALIALVAVIAGCERKVVNQASNNSQQLTGCFACHGETAFDGAILQAEGEWKNSVHASGRTVDYANRGGGSTDCTRCHSQQGFLDWLDSGRVFGPYSTVSAIHCFTCHAPHTNGTLQLRTEAAYALNNGVIFDHGAGNLCSNCHHSRMSVGDITGAATTHLTSRWGPHHGPQADIIQGTNAYQFTAAATYGQTNHKGAVPDACVGCHMGNPQQHDGYQVGGHSWNMAFEDEEAGPTEYTLVGVCQQSACHPSFTTFDVPGTVDYDGNGVVDGLQTEVLGMLDTLQSQLVAARLVSLQTGEYLPRDTVVSKDAAGAVWNFLLFGADRSEGVHNKNYYVDALTASINYVKSIQASPARRERVER